MEYQIDQINSITDQAGLPRFGHTYLYDGGTGEKFAQHEIQGVPVRITIGPKDLEKNSLEIFRRDTLEKQFIQINDSIDFVLQLLVEIQDNLYKKALIFRDEHITEVDNFEDFKNILETKGGFISAHWDGTDETENKIKELTKATIRCIPCTIIKHVRNMTRMALIP